MAAAFIAIRRRNRLRREQREREIAEGLRPPRKRSIHQALGIDPDLWLPHQALVRDVYKGPKSQVVVAVVIGVHFLVSIVQKEIDPYEEGFQKHGELWQDMEDVFNVIFLVELVVNLYGSWFKAFWRDGWNIFDFIIVANGTLNLARVETGISMCGRPETSTTQHPTLH